MLADELERAVGPPPADGQARGRGRRRRAPRVGARREVVHREPPARPRDRRPPPPPAPDPIPEVELALARSAREADTAGLLPPALVEREIAGGDPMGQLEAAGSAESAPAKPLVLRLHAVAAAAEKLAQEMDFEFLFDKSRKLFSIGYRVADGRLDSGYYDLLASEARLDELSGDRSGRGAVVALVPPGTAAHARREGLRARLVVGLDVRVPDARPHHGRPHRQPARGLDAARGRPPDPLRRRARRAVGRVGVRLQRARRQHELPVLELRRHRSRTEARALGGPRDRALRDRARRDDRPRRRGGQLSRAREGGGSRPARLLRGDRLHALAAAGGSQARRRARVHGAPPGHDPRRAGERPDRLEDAAALPLRAARPVRRAPPAGAHSARRQRLAASRRGDRIAEARPGTGRAGAEARSSPRTTRRRAPTSSRTAATP